MAYTYTDGVTITYPDGATVLRSDVDTVIQNVTKARNERMDGLTGATWASQDPVTPTKYGVSISISTKIPYCPEYDAGNSGASITLNLTTNGPNQKLTLTAACTLTIASPVAGASGYIRTVQNGTGGYALTWPSNVEFEGDTAPTVTTTALKCTIYPWISDGTKIYVGVFGTNYSVS